MNPSEELVPLLDRQIEMLQARLLIMQKMTDCVLVNDMDRLRQLLQEELDIEADIAVLERQVQELRAGIADALGRPADTVTLANLLESSDGPEAIALNDRRERILALIDQLRRESSSTARLVRFALEFNSDLLSALLGSPIGARVYSADGSVSERAEVASFRHSV